MSILALTANKVGIGDVMDDAPAVTCGDKCGGCSAECAACSAQMCADCGGCNHAREMGRRGRAAAASLALLQIGLSADFGFNPLQKRGPDGRFIKMGGPGSAGGKRRGKPKAERPVESVAAPAAPKLVPDTGPDPADYGNFTPTEDAAWNLLQKRLGKRTPKTDAGEPEVGDVVPTRDGKWQEVIGGAVPKYLRDSINVRDDAKNYRHTENIPGIKRRVADYAAEQAWRDAGGSKARLEGRAPTPKAQREGQPQVGEDGKYARPVKQYAVMPDGTVETRSSRNPYQYVAQYVGRDGTIGWTTWHRTRELAQRGNLTPAQRKDWRVGHVAPVTLENPQEEA